MALQGVPWAIGNGAHNQVEGARLSLYAATGGRGGVMSPTDMMVTALPVPGGAVRVHTGGVVIVSGYPGASSQAYAAREVSSTDVDIDATGSSGARTRYLVVRVHDHQYSGEPTPSNVQDGPYNAYEWISQDPRTTDLPYPVEGIAKVVQPANTATITDAMIEDIRQLAQPRSQRVLHARPRVMDDSTGNAILLNGLVENGGEYFPGGAGSPNTFTVDAPEWATRMIIRADWLAVRYQANTNPHGRYWVEFGDEYRDHGWNNNRQWEFGTQLFQFDSPGASNNTMRTNWILGDSVALAPKLRGKRVTFAFKAGVNLAANRGHVSMDSLGGLIMEVTFVQEALDAHTVTT